MDNSAVLTQNTKIPSTECVIVSPPDIPERMPFRLRTSSGQHMLSCEHPSNRNTHGTSSVRIMPTSIEKISNSLTNQFDFEIDRSPLLNHSIQMDKTQIGKARPRNLSSKRLSNPFLDEISNCQNDNLDTISKSPLTEQATRMNIFD